MYSAYQSGASLSAVAKAHGKHRQNVWAGFRRRGWPMRERNDAVRLMSQRGPTFEELLSEAMERPTLLGCCEWPGPRHTNGYGLYRGQYAHRLSWERANGKSPGRLHILHTCDNPPCVSPTHLYRGTHADNMADMSRRWRVGTSKLTREHVAYIRKHYKPHDPVRGAMPLGKQFGVGRQTIQAVAAGRRYAHGWRCHTAVHDHTAEDWLAWIR